MEEGRLLPPDLIELQIGQIDLLLAMYPEDTKIEEHSTNIFEELKRVADGDSEMTITTQASVAILFRLAINPDETDVKILDLDLTVPFTSRNGANLEEPPRVKFRIRQPPWLNRAATNQLTAGLPEDEDLLGTIEHLKDAAMQQLQQSNSTALDESSQDTTSNNSGPLVRVWFYFPSISTRSKRDDFIIHAPSYKLTGFLYAGKPGLLCVEGTSKAIDDYMKFIKTESWGDIPAHHKKVSERYRESGDNNAGVDRVFPDMTEITDMVGERRGQRANRGDMKAMEEWLVERRLGDAFAKVLM